MSKARPLIFLLGAVLVLAGGGWGVKQYFFSAKETKVAAITPAVHVVVAAVTRSDVPQLVKQVGAVYPYLAVAVKSRQDSQVVAVQFHDGDRVNQGDVLFKLDDRSLLAQRAQLAANFDRDTVQLKNAKATLDRSQQLIAQGYVTHEKLEQDKTAFEAQRAALAATKAAMDSTQVALDYATIRAPISGRAGTITATVGNNVKNNDQPLVTINQVDPILVQIAVPQRYFDRLKAAMGGEKLIVIASRPEMATPVEGTLEYIDNAIDASTGTFVVRARFANPQEKLWPGMFVDTALNLGALKNLPTVPTPAVQGSADNHFVFVVDPVTKKAAKRSIKITGQGDDVTVIDNGLQDGEFVVVDGILRLTDGAMVDFVAPIGQVAP
jgi:multidrug efflux system membrane fusion protein